MRKRSGSKIESWGTRARMGFHDEVCPLKQLFEIYQIDSFQEDHKFPKR